MKNNIRALTLHMVFAAGFFILIAEIVTSSPIAGRHIANLAVRILLSLIIILGYFFFGTFLYTDKDKKYDFLTGIIIALIGFVIWLYTFFKTGMNILYVPEESAEYWVVMNIYHSPFTAFYYLTGIPHTPLLSLLTNIFPSFLMGCGLKYKRKKGR